MIDLIYPLDGPAPMLSQNSKASMAKERVDMEEGGAHAEPEIFPIVEPDGTVVARATREYCHSGIKVLHPVVHLHLIDRQERIYLQKRSMKKDIQPGKWDTAVGGHVMYGEGIMEALHRESYEELSLSDYNPVYLGAYSYDTGRDLEFVSVFAAIGHFNVKPDLDEVDEGKWLTFEQVDKMASRGLLTPNFKSEFADIRGKLLSLL